MNISPHLFIDAVILIAALIITLLLRDKGNAAREEKESKWLFKKKIFGLFYPEFFWNNWIL